MTVQPDTGAGSAVDFAEIVADVLEVEPDQISDPAGPDTLRTWTSLRHLQLVVTLEEAYGVSLSYREIRNVTSIGQLRAALRSRGVAT